MARVRRQQSLEPKPKERHPLVSETAIFGIVLLIAVALAPFYYKGQAAKSVPSQPAPTTPLSPLHVPDQSSVSQRKAEDGARLGALLWSLGPYIRMLVIGIPAKILSISFRPLAFIFSVLYQIFSPFLVLFQILSSIFILTPWRVARWIGRLVYPIYVFCGVAALVGATFGLLGVLIGKMGIWMMAAQESGSDYEEDSDLDYLPPNKKQLPKLKTEDLMEQPKGKGKEKGILKEENSPVSRKKRKSVVWAE